MEVDEITILFRIAPDPVAGAVEAAAERHNWERLPNIANYSVSGLPASLGANKAAGITAGSADWHVYESGCGVVLGPHVIGPMAADVILRWSHCGFSNLKRWALNVYYGLRLMHLHFDLNEIVFRINRRDSMRAAVQFLSTIRTAPTP